MKLEQLPLLLFLIPFSASLLLTLARLFGRRYYRPLAASAMGISALLSIWGVVRISRSSPLNYRLSGWAPPIGIEWSLDLLSALMAALVCVIAFVVIFATGKPVDREIGESSLPFYMLSLLLIAGLLGIILTRDLFNLYVFLEVASLSGYALVASGPERSRYAALRYLLIGSIAASFYLLGVGYIYAATGTLNMADVAERIRPLLGSRTTLMGLILIFAGLAIKMGLFPFHAWLPDAYSYASNPAAALIAPLMTKVAIYALVRILFWLFGAELVSTTIPVTLILVWLGATAIVVGSIAAFMQSDFRRMLAYSSVSHIGLMVLGIGLNHNLALTGALLHVINHAFMKACLFLVATAAAYQHGVRDVFDFGRLRHRMPWTMAAFAVAALSMVGVPPLCGFFSKWYILLGAIRAGKPLFALLIVASSLLTALYFFKVIEQAFLTKRGEERRVAEGPLPLVAATGFLALCIVLLGLFAPRIFALIMGFVSPQQVPY